MKFRTILTFAFTIALAFAQMSDVEDNAYASGNDVAAGNDISSDVETNVDNAGAEAADVSTQTDGSAINNGEASDDYGDVAGVNSLDSGEASDNDSSEQGTANTLPQTAPEGQQPVEFTGASGEAAPIASGLEALQGSEAAPQGAEKPTVALDDSSKSDEPIGTAKIATGLVGAAAVSSAGIFFFMKRSKRRGLESVRSQISMA